VHRLLKLGHELLVGTSDCHLLKYEATLGYNGYYKSQSLSEVYDIVDLGGSLGQGVVAISGKSGTATDDIE
jgi:hypothetical protein